MAHHEPTTILRANEHDPSLRDWVSARRVDRIVERSGLPLARVVAALTDAPEQTGDAEAVARALDASGWSGPLSRAALAAWARAYTDTTTTPAA